VGSKALGGSSFSTADRPCGECSRNFWATKMATGVSQEFSSINLNKNKENALLNSPPKQQQVRQMYARANACCDDDTGPEFCFVLF